MKNILFVMSSRLNENITCKKNWQNFSPVRLYRKIRNGLQSNNFMKCLCKIIIRQIEAWCILMHSYFIVLVIVITPLLEKPRTTAIAVFISRKHVAIGSTCLEVSGRTLFLTHPIFDREQSLPYHCRSCINPAWDYSCDLTSFFWKLFSKNFFVEIAIWSS